MTIPKLSNPPPRPDRELQKPMVIEGQRTERKIPSFPVRFLIVATLALLFMAAAFGYAFFTLHYPHIGIPAGVVFFVISMAFIATYDDTLWRS